MPPESTSKSTRAGLSLYANLLDPSTSSTSGASTISRAPVVFKQPPGTESREEEAAAQKQQLSTASLRFQPTKRPQLSAQKPKPKPSSAKPGPPASNPSPQAAAQDPPSSAARPVLKNTLADWTATGDDEDVNGFYGAGEKRQRGGRKKRKKNKEESHMVQNWDDIYDPSRPNNYEEYQRSDEKLREVREWKDRLYAHRTVRRWSAGADSEGEDRSRPRLHNQFAPPPMSFAPPPTFDSVPPPPERLPTTSVPDDPTGEDAYARRMRLSQQQQQQQQPPPPPPQHQPHSQAVSEQLVALTPPHSRLSTLEPVEAGTQPTQISARPPAPTISRAPVRYNFPPAPAELPNSEAELEIALQQEDREEDEPRSDDVPRSLRPGQLGFAERLMSKYGWAKGSGLGASGSGIVNPLRVQLEKQKKKPDSEGGGFVGPGGRGKIIGGKKQGGPGEANGGKFGVMSEVIILEGMVDGMDLHAELEGTGDGGLMQEIGEECGEKYGRVERVFIDRSKPTNAPVFVKFTSQLSALRAVNALEGRIFNGNTIKARFYDGEKFEKGIYV
ncbi:RNA recognition motif domain [Lasallia pustulata]|uniref:RNA recognition motif domain n=1 Tax=Lasallia pustulata TaxID=136370 RepID=A0A1W5DD39_9LECA|nr:RNA recognition motif domain [Lasallia pustulata]